MQMDETRAREVLASTLPEGSMVQRLVLSGQSPDQEMFTIDEAVAAMLAFAAPPALSPTLHPADREAIARELAEYLASGVSGTSGGDMDDCDDFDRKHPAHRQAYLDAADAILALSGSLAPAEGGEPRGGLGGERTCCHCGGEGDIDDGDHPCFTCGGTGKVPSAALPPSTEKGETK